MTRGIRGAITVDNNTCDAVKDATVTLLTEILNKNKVKKEDISHAVFTLTDDLNAVFPAKYAREELGWDYVPMVCFNELKVENAITMCLRVLLVINTEKNQTEINHIYLKGAEKLRPDLK